MEEAFGDDLSEISFDEDGGSGGKSNDMTKFRKQLLNEIQAFKEELRNEIKDKLQGKVNINRSF